MAHHLFSGDIPSTISRKTIHLTINNLDIKLIPIQQAGPTAIELVLQALLKSENYAPFFGYRLEYARSISLQERYHMLTTIFNNDLIIPYIPIGPTLTLGQYIIQIDKKFIGTFTMHRASEYRGHYNYYVIENPERPEFENIEFASTGILSDSYDNLIFPDAAFSPSIFINGPFRRKGIADGIFHFCFKEIRNAGFDTISLASKDNPASIHMHEKLGLVTFAEGFVRNTLDFDNDIILKFKA